MSNFRRSVSVSLCIASVLLASSLGIVDVSRAADEASAADGATAGKDAKKAKEKPPVFFLRDGGKVTGLPKVKSVKVETKYGVLEVPVSDLVQIRLSRRVDSSIQKKIEAAIEKLGNDDFDIREEAMDEIRAIGADAKPFLRKARKSENEEIKNRAEILVEELDEASSKKEEKVGSEVPSLKGDQDEVITRRFTIKGRVLADQFSVSTRYGTLAFAASDVVGVFFARGGKSSKKVDVPGSKNAPANWVKTGVTVVKGQPLNLQASGTLTVSNYGLTAGPGGTTRYSGSSFSNFPYLSLVGKIGKKGKPFLVGAKYKKKANANGELFLSTVRFRSYVPTGSFKVKIVAGE
ncbi:MAG: hypothetical protein AAF517_12500 [Planctomycetota bacterium]